MVKRVLPPVPKRTRLQRLSINHATITQMLKEYPGYGWDVIQANLDKREIQALCYRHNTPTVNEAVMSDASKDNIHKTLWELGISPYT